MTSEMDLSEQESSGTMTRGEKTNKYFTPIFLLKCFLSKFDFDWLSNKLSKSTLFYKTNCFKKLKNCSKKRSPMLIFVFDFWYWKLTLKDRFRHLLTTNLEVCESQTRNIFVKDWFLSKIFCQLTLVLRTSPLRSC